MAKEKEIKPLILKVGKLYEIVQEGTWWSWPCKKNRVFKTFNELKQDLAGISFVPLLLKSGSVLLYLGKRRPHEENGEINIFLWGDKTICCSVYMEANLECYLKRVGK